MNQTFDIEAAIKLVETIGLRPAARHYDLDRTTLASRIKAHKAKQSREQPQAALTPQAAQPAVEQPEAEPTKTERRESYLWSLIRRYEDETRRLYRKPPLTDDEWRVAKQQIQATEIKDWPGIND
jgi:hypothetical protein